VCPEAALPAAGPFQDLCPGHLRSEDLRSEDLCPEALRCAGHLRPEDLRSEDLRSEDLRSEVRTHGPAGRSSGCEDLLPEDLLPEA
jgi:hypothetical protein